MRCLLLDLDGVLRRWDPATVADAERDAGLPAGALGSVAFAPDLLLRAVTGEIDDETWRSAITDRLVTLHGSRAAEAVEFWSGPAGTVDPEVLELVRDVRRDHEVALLTNATSRLDRDLAELGLLDEVDHVLNSSELGVAKPDPRAFLTACARVGYPPSRCWFVDDTVANVTAASSVGIRSHHFTSTPALRHFLRG